MLWRPKNTARTVETSQECLRDAPALGGAQRRSLTDAQAASQSSVSALCGIAEASSILTISHMLYMVRVLSFADVSSLRLLSGAIIRREGPTALAQAVSSLGVKVYVTTPDETVFPCAAGPLPRLAHRSEVGGVRSGRFR